MVTAIGVVLIMGVYTGIEMRSMWRKKWKKEMWTFLILMIIAMALSFAQILNLKIPNPLDWITFIFKPVSDWLMHTLK